CSRNFIQWQPSVTDRTSNIREKSMRLRIPTILLAACLMPWAERGAERSFHLMEASITDIHQAMQAGTLTCHSLVQQYLDRIEAYDKQGPAVNPLRYVNPHARQQADAMDQEFKRTRKLKPLACIPIVLKDNFETGDMPTTVGSVLLKGAQPPKD